MTAQSLLKPASSAMLAAALLAICTTSMAETCKYVDGDGRVIYSNTPNNPPKGAKKVKCFDDPAPKQAPAAATPKGSSDAKPSRDPFPKVDGETQKKRDDDRRAILEQELGAEQQQLEQAKQKLAEQEAVRTGEERNYQKFIERVQPYRDAVTTHERNIEALNREIANLK